MTPSKKRAFLIAMLIAAGITELGNRTASVPLSRVSAVGWMVATVVWPAGIHEGTSTAAVGSIILAFVVNLTIWTLVLYSLARFVEFRRGSTRSN